MSTPYLKYLDETLTLTQALIRIPSHNPPGNEDAIAAFAQQWLVDHGVSSMLVKLEQGRSSVVARIPGSAAGSIVLCGHLDTVTANEAAWQHRPAEPVIEEDRLWGLGAADMKSAVAVLMQTVARLAQTGRPPEKDIVLVLTADEEWGYRGAKSVAESDLIDDAELLVIAEPTSNNVYVGQKGELWIEAAFTGKEAHGSMPETGANTILPAAHFCTRLHDEVARWPETPGKGRTTLNIGRFDGGRQVNIVPSLATVQLDVRVISHEHHNLAVRAVSDIGTQTASAAGCEFSAREMAYHPPILTVTNQPWALKLLEAARTATGHPQPQGLSPYSTDAVSITPILDIPVLICGPGSIEQAHQPNEFIELSQIAQSLELFTAFVA